ncbi:MAG: LuxR C-terminal-related transcriptional regulator [Candidatus Acidiferrales bacterium]
MTDGSVARTDDSPNLEHIKYLLTGIFNAASVGLAVFDAQMQVVIANPAFAAMIANSSVADCVGKTICEILGCAAEDLELAVKAALDTGKQHSSVDIMTKMPHAGLVNHWLFNLFPIKDHVDGRLQVAAVAVETSHQKRIEQYFLTLMADLGWIREQISKNPIARQNRGELLRPISERTGFLEAVSEEVRSVSALLQGGANISLCRTEAVDRSEPANQPKSARQKADELASLSPRELQVLTLAGRGKSNKEIASLAGLSIKTVETYRNRLGLKLDLHSTIEIVLYAVRNHLISLTP